MGHADEILALVESERRRLDAIGDAAVSRRPAPGKWSRKELVGHLVDSALNNHQRIVRAELADALEFPGYAQEEWVRCQGYADADWADLVALWAAVNRHLARVVRLVPPEKLSVPCRVDGGPMMSLGDLVADYLRHLHNHLARV